MTAIQQMEDRIKEIIDSLKGLCATNGLSNQAEEERIITSVFLYKFLNDKFMYNLARFAEEIGLSVEDVLKNKHDELDAFYDANATEVAFEYKDTIQYLINSVEQKDFYKQFDEALVRISSSVRNEMFSVETAEGTNKPLFEPISTPVEPSAKNNFAKAIFGIIAQEKFDFSRAFQGNFDFYSAIFEYLIKDYNVASGTYAEYFTPQAVSSIIAKILVGMSNKIEAAEIYDPSAGSGSLILHLAHELGREGGMNRAIVYTQDISNKSTRFLRLNMMLNEMMESLGNIVQGDTLLRPAHYNKEHEPASGLKKYSYITSNPPFKLDFSSTRNAIEQNWQDTDRFFAGIPKIPNKKKGSMAVYLLFIQHIIYSLKPDGKAAIVVPTGFLTAQSGIEKTIRQKLINERMLKGVISMPSSIFANTGTNVSIVFIDKANNDGKVLLMDASKLGTKVKSGKNQRTVLSDDEVKKIIDTFIGHEIVDDFSVSVTYDKIAEKNYSFSAGQYFAVKIEHSELTPREFAEKMAGFTTRLDEMFAEGQRLEKEIKAQLGRVKYV
jgi:type I restriction enzyme M protein